MDTFLTALTVVVGAGAVAVVIAFISHKVLPESVRDGLREHSSQVTTAVGALFAITAGFLVVSTWNAVGTASNNVAEEAHALTDIYWYAHSLPEPERANMQTLLRGYVDLVNEEEWPLMAEKQDVSDKGWDQMRELRAQFLTIDPGGGGEGTRYGQALSKLDDLIEARRTRAVEASSGVPGIMWAAILLGATMVLSVPVVVGATNLRIHMILAFLSTGVIAFILFLIFEMNHAFEGAVEADATPMEELPGSFDNVDNTRLRDHVTVSPPPPPEEEEEAA